MHLDHLVGMSNRRLLKKREKKRGDREIGNAECQVKQGLYPSEGYTIIVDTSELSMADCVKRITNALRLNTKRRIWQRNVFMAFQMTDRRHSHACCYNRRSRVGGDTEASP